METQYKGKIPVTEEDLAQIAHGASDLVSRMTKRANELCNQRITRDINSHLRLNSRGYTPESLVLNQHSSEADNLAGNLGTSKGWNIQVVRAALDSLVNSPLVIVDESVRTSSEVSENVRGVVERAIYELREWVSHDEYLAHGQRADGGFVALKKVNGRIVPTYIDCFTQTVQ